jgi:cytochrome c-type biogenesis protein CcmF
LSREGAFLANNLLFAAFALVVLVGTVFPLVAEAYDGRQLSVGEPYFDTMTRPVGIALLFLMAVAPALPWRAAGADVLHRRLVVPAWVAALSMLAAAAVGLRGLAPLAAVGLGAFALAGIVRSFGVGLAARRRHTGEGIPKALLGMVGGNSRLYGGLVVHAGVVVFALALTMSSAFSVEREVRLARGATASVRGYDVTYLGDRTERSARKTTVSADVRVRRGGRTLGLYAPALSSYPGATQAIGTPSVRTGVREDVYLTLVSAPTDAGVVLGIRVNPMVVWLWIGAGIMVAGTVVAAWPTLPTRRRRPRRVGQTTVSGTELVDVDAPVDAGVPA